MASRSDGVAHLYLADVLHAGNEIADLPRSQRWDRHCLGRDDSDFLGAVGFPGDDEFDAITGPQGSVHHPDIANDPAVDVVIAIEHQSPERGVGIAHRSRDPMDDLFKQGVNAGPGLGGQGQDFLRGCLRGSRPIRRSPARGRRRPGRSC